MKVTIYRVENESLIGPYAADYTDYTDRVLSSQGCEKRPAPSWDGLPRVTEDKKFGFSSIEQLIDWFDIYLDPLEGAGFCVVRIEVDHKRVFHGRRQLMFREYVKTAMRMSRRTVVPWEVIRSSL